MLPAGRVRSGAIRGTGRRGICGSAEAAEAVEADLGRRQRREHPAGGRDGGRSFPPRGNTAGTEVSSAPVTSAVTYADTWRTRPAVSWAGSSGRVPSTGSAPSSRLVHPASSATRVGTAFSAEPSACSAPSGASPLVRGEPAACATSSTTPLRMETRSEAPPSPPPHTPPYATHPPPPP